MFVEGGSELVCQSCSDIENTDRVVEAEDTQYTTRFMDIKLEMRLKNGQERGKSSVIDGCALSGAHIETEL